MARDATNGLISGSTLGSVTDTYTRNGFGEPLTYTAPSLNITYTRDDLGRITRKVESFLGGPANTIDYSYDRTGRLTQVLKNSAVVGSYAYDSNSNRISSNGIAATYDAQDRIVSFGAITYGFNANGELQSKVNTLTGQITNYRFDAFGNLKSVTLPNGTIISYKHDGFNRRVARLVNGVMEKGWLYIDQLRPVAEIDGSGNLVSVFGYASKSNSPDLMVRAGVRYRIVSDHLGSPRLVINSSTGVVAQALEYDEWGNVISDSNPGFQPFGFAGGLTDSTGLVKFGAREFLPENSRWISKDPILFKGGSASLYEYAGSDPINNIDPSGLKIKDATGGKIPPEVKNSALYRQLDADPLVDITIAINNTITSDGRPIFGRTSLYSDGSLTIDINESRHSGLPWSELVDTYFHELNHAQLLSTGMSGGELIDSEIILPGRIRSNFGNGGITNGQCR